MTVSLEASLGGQSDDGTIRLSAAGVPGPPEVTPDGGRQTGEAGVESRLAFNVHNPGTAANTYTLSCRPSACGTDATVDVAAGGDETVHVEYTPQDTGSITVTLTAARGGQEDDGTIVLHVGTDGVEVTPKGGVQGAELNVASRVRFTVENLGTAGRTYTLDCAPGGCSAPGSVFVPAGRGVNVDVDHTPGAYGTTTVSLTATGGGESDEGWIDLEVDRPPPPGIPQVTPLTATQSGRVGVESVLWYRVRNPGTAADAYTLRCAPSGCASATTTGTLAGGRSTDVSVRYTPSAEGSYRVSLTAGSASGADTGTTTLVVQPEGAVSVTPAAGAASVPEGTSQTQAFGVVWSGASAAELDVSVRCEGDLSGCALSRSRVTLGGANPSSAVVTVSYRAGSARTPPDAMVVRAEHASNASLAAEGMVTVTATPTPEISVSVDGANPGYEALRGECLILASGAGAIECDDYRIDYPLLPVTRMNVPRALSLLYNSALASPKPVVGAHVTPPSTAAADSIVAELHIGGSVVRRVMQPVRDLVAGVENRIAFALDRYLDRGNRVEDYEVVVRQYHDGAEVGSGVRAEGEYISLDRRGAFGRGWWPAGYERIDPLADGRLLWSGGDGSARVYEPDPAAANTWVAKTRGRADTIVYRAGSAGTGPRYLDLSNGPGQQGEYGVIAGGAHQGLSDRSKMTWAFWMQPRGQAGRLGGLVSQGGGSSAWWFGLEDDGDELAVNFINPGNALRPASLVSRVTTGSPFQAGAWHFVVVQFDGTRPASRRLRAWVDGASVGLVVPPFTFETGQVPGSLAAAPNTPFEWGRVSAVLPGFDGLMGETAIVGDVLTSAERAQWLSQGIDFDHPALVAGYDWGGSLDDRGPLGNDLSGTGIEAADYGETDGYPNRRLQVAAGYVRTLIGGGEVHYDTSGRHTSTVDRSGNETRFVHETVAGEVRLSAIELPTPGGWDDAYRFGYDASGRLTSVSALGGDGTMQVYGISTTSTSVDGHPSDGYTIDAITAPDGRVTRFGYAARGDGMLERVTDARGAVTEIAYTASKVSEVRVLTPNDAAIPDITMAYEAASTVGSGVAGAPAPQMADSVSAVFDGPRTDVADTTRFFINGWGAVRAIRDALGNETRLTRGNAAYPAYVTRADHPNDYEVTAQYDAGGLLSSTWNNAANASTAYQWNTAWSRVTRITTPEGVVTSYTYDPSTGDRLSVDAGGTVTRYGYNAAGQVTAITGAAGDVTRLAYSADQGNLASATTPEGHTSTYAHDRAGMRTVTRSPAHAGTGGTVFRVDSLYYDVMGRDTLAVSRSTDAAETAWLKVRTAYDAVTGDRLSVIPYADHPVTGSMTTGANRWSYDGLGRVETEQGAGTDSLVYDVAGNVVRRFKLRPAGTPVPVHAALRYDALNRLVERVTPEKFYAADTTAMVAPFPYYSQAGLTIRADTATFAYDAAGNLIRADNGYASVVRTYTRDGLVATETQRIRRYRDPGIADPGYAQSYTLAYGYDRDRRRIEIRHPAILGGDTTHYAYAGAHRPAVHPHGPRRPHLRVQLRRQRPPLGPHVPRRERDAELRPRRAAHGPQHGRLGRPAPLRIAHLRPPGQGGAGDRIEHRHGLHRAGTPEAHVAQPGDRVPVHRRDPRAQRSRSRASRHRPQRILRPRWTAGGQDRRVDARHGGGGRLDRARHLDGARVQPQLRRRHRGPAERGQHDRGVGAAGPGRGPVGHHVRPRVRRDPRVAQLLLGRRHAAGPPGQPCEARRARDHPPPRHPRRRLRGLLVRRARPPRAQAQHPGGRRALRRGPRHLPRHDRAVRLGRQPDPRRGAGDGCLECRGGRAGGAPDRQDRLRAPGRGGRPGGHGPQRGALRAPRQLARAVRVRDELAGTKGPRRRRRMARQQPARVPGPGRPARLGLVRQPRVLRHRRQRVALPPEPLL